MWDQQAHTLANTDFHLPAEGLTCFVPGSAPSLDAVYFLSVCGKAWQFTQAQDGSLVAKAIPALQPFDKSAAFVFAAGTAQHNALYFGQFGLPPAPALPTRRLHRYTDLQVHLKRYDKTSWQDYAPQVLMFARQQNQDVTPITHTAQAHVFPCTGCTFRKGQERWGCCLLPVAYVSASYNPPTYASACFVFDPTAQKFTPCMPTLLLAKTNPQRFATGLELEQPGKLVFFEEKVADSSPILSLADGLPTELPIKVHNPFSGHRDWESFSICVDRALSVLMPIFTAKSNNVRHFYQVDATQKLEPIKSTPLDLSGDSVVLPFADQVYLVTASKDHQAGSLVYYKGTFKPA